MFENKSKSDVIEKRFRELLQNQFSNEIQQLNDLSENFKVSKEILREYTE
jgi:hypothetical protein